MLKRLTVILISLLVLTGLFAEGAIENASTPKYVASTS